MAALGRISGQTVIAPVADTRALREATHMLRLFLIPLKILLVIVVVPVAAIAALISAMFGLKAELSALEVAASLRNFTAGDGGDREWDDFISVPIADPDLEDLRRRAAAVDLPVTAEGLVVLRELLVEACNLARLQTET